MAPITIQDLIGASDGVSEAFLAQTYPALANAISGPLYWAAIIYWCLYGYKVHAGYEPLRWNSVLARAYMTTAIFSSLYWGGLAQQFYHFFTSFMEGTAATIMAGKPTAMMIDSLWNDIGAVSALLQKVSWYQLGMILQGFSLFVLNNLLFVLALVYMTIAKFGAAITMVLLPVFLGFFLFEQTRQWGMNWLSMMLNFSFIYILVIAIVRFGFLAFGNAISEASKAADATDAALINIQQVGNLFIIEGVLVMFMLQVKSWAAALSGGVTVQGISVLMHLAKHLKGAGK